MLNSLTFVVDFFAFKYAFLVNIVKEDSFFK